ncbi:T9SS type A sorting domain-containing protein [Spirosoma rhododendri]|uniref:T9SS type A sorting domain-containing protein n=1 Tax=Spirosoma rhododendri TaxID=2728024 RepID=A0A7L5DN02_9BACT|nr:T9SS type A sorting domain-containing protein [Spirosoma rhododendri]QJD78593.1 T9SS type A sorting domain-containing protein [Spirosoma rhododendri]
MQQFLLRCFSFLVLCGLGLPLNGLAQGITVSTLSPSATCAGKTITVPFSTTGTFNAGNTFTAQLSDASGTFGASTVAIGTLSSSPSSGTAATNLTITATVPANTAAGSAYQVRVSSSGPARTSANSVGLTVGTPGTPGVTDRTYCQGATATALSASPVSGASLNWYTVASGGTPSSVAPTPATSTTGVVSYYVSQSLNGCESNRATLNVTVYGTPGAPSTQASFSACQGATLSALSATPDNGATLIWYGNSANGGTGSSVAPVPDNQAPATYYVSQARGTCESARSAITVTIRQASAAPGVSAPPAYCPGQTATALSATPSSGGTLNWYGTNATGGTPSSSATIPSTTTPGTLNYYVSQTLSGCESPRAGIAVTVKQSPSAPGISTPVGVCQNQSVAPLTATPSSGGTLNWYGTNQTGGSPSTTAPTPSVTAVGTTVYYVSQTVNGCEGPRAGISVTVSGLPGAPTVQASSTFCQGTILPALQAAADNGATLNWYGTNQTGGSSSTNAPVPSNQKSETYYVSQTRNGCEGPRAAISVVIRQSPSAPTVSAPPSYCPGQTAAALTATSASGSTLNWYGTNATGGSPSTTATVPSTSTPGTRTYYVSQSTDGCESTRASISITVKPTPAAPGVTNLSLCQNQSAGALTATTASGSTINWYGTSQTGTPSTTAPTPSVAATGSTPYYVSQTVDGCESAQATITVAVNAVPGQPSIASAGPYCSGVTAQPLSATGTALRWYGTSQSGGSGSSAATTPSTGSTGTTTYYATQTVNGCESERAGVAIVVKQTPARPDVVNLTFCQNTNAPGLTATASAGATLNWYGTSAIGGTSTTAAPALSSTTPGTTTYYVSQTLDGCESANRSGIAVVVKQTPGAPGVTPVDYCNGAGSQQLSATGSNIKWYDGSGNSLSGAPTPPTNTVGQQTYQATQTVDGCESQQKASLTVTIKPLPGLPGVANLSYCQPTQDQPAQNVAPVTASGDNLRWYNTDGNAFQSAPTPSITQAGTYAYQVTQTVNGCSSDKATLQVTVNTAPTPTVSTSLVSYCINATATPLQASAANGGTLRWIDPYNRTFNEAPTPSTLNSNVTPGGDAFYVYQIGANGCYSARSTIRVIVNVVPTLALNGSSDVNLGSLAPVKLSFTGAPPFSYTLTDGYSGVSRTNDTTIYVLPRGNTTYQIVSVANSCGVGLPGNPATATITVRVPTITTSALQTTTVCAGSSFAVPFTTTGQFNAGNLFTSELVSVADTSRKITVSPNGTTGTVVTAALPLTLAAGQYYVRVKGSNPSVGVIGSSSPSILTVRSRATATLTGTQSIFEGSPATLTLTFGGEAPWTFAYADSLRSYTVTATSSPYALEVRPSRNTTYQLTSVSNNCGVGTAASGTAVVTVQKVLGVEDPALGPLVSVYPVPTTTTLTIDIDAALTRDPAVLTLHDGGGRPVLNQTTRTRQTTLDVSQQPAGTYLLRIQVGDRQVVRRILIQ